jgi:hypothetical protein
MPKFNVGDRIIWKRLLHGGYDYFIPKVFFGSEATITKLGTKNDYGMSYIVTFYRVVIGTRNSGWHIVDKMFDSVAPLSPFDAAVQSYIDRELRDV